MKNISTIRLITPKKLSLIFLLVFVCSTANLFLPVTGLAQGFGSGKMKMYLYPKQAPKVFPTNTKFSVRLYAQPTINEQKLQQLKESLETKLADYDLRFNPVAAKPDIVISCVIPELNAFSTYETHYTLVQTDMSAEADIRSPLGSTLEPYILTIFEGHLTAQYAARDAATGKTLDADTFTVDFKQGYEQRVPHLNDLYDLLINNLAHMVAARFVPDFYSVEVNLPKGNLKRASELLQNGYWNSALECLNGLPQFKKAEDESFRLYTIGLAYEGLAYETPYLMPTKDYLEKALSYYEQAASKNAGEMSFQAATLRVNNLLKDYRNIEPFVRAYEKSEHKKELETSIVNKIQSRFGKADFINNNTIISMVKGGLSDKEIAEKITKTKSKYFELSPNGLSTLTAAKVSANVIDTMREAMRGRAYDGKKPRKWNEMAFDSILAVYPNLLLR
jgi:hypothetical protein